VTSRLRTSPASHCQVFFRHPLGIGSAWLYHQRLNDGGHQVREAPSAWYLSVVWQPAGTGSADGLPEPVL